MGNGFYNSIFNPNAGSPSAFTSPGMDPMALQKMLQMQGGVGGGGMQPGVGMMPPPPGPGMPQPVSGQMPQQGGNGASPMMPPMDGLQRAIAAMRNGGAMGGGMDQGRMQQIQQLLQKLQQGGGMAGGGMQQAGMTPPNMPGMFGAQGT